MTRRDVLKQTALAAGALATKYSTVAGSAIWERPATHPMGIPRGIPAQIKWDVETKFGVTKENAKPGTDLALAAVADHFAENAGDEITLKYGSGVYNFLGQEPSIDLIDDLDPGENGRLVFEGDGMRATTFVTVDGSTAEIDGRNVYRITFRGIHFARNYYTITQGTVVSVNVNTEELLMELHEGFPTPEEIWSIRGKPLNQGKYLRKYSNAPDDPAVILEDNEQVHWDPENTRQAEGRKCVFQIDRNFDQAQEYQPGDILGVKCKHGANTYKFSGGDDIVFENCLWTHRSRGVFRGGTSNIRFSGCRIERLPALNGWTPCLATPGGGPQIGQPNDPRITGIVVEDCDFNSCGDDNIALFNVDGAIIRNTYSYNSFAANIKLYRCTDITVENTEVVNGYCLIREDYDGDERTLTGIINTVVNPTGGTAVEVRANSELPKEFNLSQNFPNF